MDEDDMTGRSRARGARLAVAAALILTGCGGTTGGSDGESASPAGPGAASGPASAGTVVTAVETEFAIELSESRFSPGRYTFQVQNQGAVPHDLTIQGPGVDQQATATLQAGQSGELPVTLREGTYELWCSIGSHRGQGMEITIQVG